MQAAIASKYLYTFLHETNQNPMSLITKYFQSYNAISIISLNLKSMIETIQNLIFDTRN